MSNDLIFFITCFFCGTSNGNLEHYLQVISKHVFFIEPGFHSVYYLGTMPRFVKPDFPFEA